MCFCLPALFQGAVKTNRKKRSKKKKKIFGNDITVEEGDVDTPSFRKTGKTKPKSNRAAPTSARLVLSPVATGTMSSPTSGTTSTPSTSPFSPNFPVPVTSTTEPARGSLRSRDSKRARMSEQVIEDFVTYVTGLGINGLRKLFQEELSKIEVPGPTVAFDANKSKNRFPNIPCYDETRVKLVTEDASCGDYIHANWVRFDHHDRVFIATQGPSEHTREDFWRMVFDQQAPRIICLSKKCSQYWPEGPAGTYKTYGNFHVNVKKVEEDHYFTITTLEVLPQGCSNSLIVIHIRLHEWPTNGTAIAGRTIIKMLKTVTVSDRLATGPVVVHCSGGVGRTSVVICIDVILQKLIQNAEPVNLVEMFKTLRRQRACALQTEGHFVLVVACIIDYLYVRLPNSKFNKSFVKFREDFRKSGI